MSNANSFFVTYADGATTTINSTCESVEAFCNEHFGSSWDVAKEHGATVTMNGNLPEGSTESGVDEVHATGESIVGSATVDAVFGEEQPDDHPEE
jgi:hypothetical protein